jgi:oligopeptide/dipeptide ABC transporter ATP-binding protein
MNADVAKIGSVHTDLQQGTDVLRVLELRKSFPVPRRPSEWLRFQPASRVVAVDDVSFGVSRGEILGIVGESGSGKSTLARCLLGLEVPDSGAIHFWDGLLDPTDKQNLHKLRSRVQIVFQDPYAALNPRMRVGDAIAEAARFHHSVANRGVDGFVDELLGLVGLPPDVKARRPRQLSGGQRQRVVIARALAVRPEILVADEAVSALDVSVQAQILNLLRNLQEELGLTIILISHQLSVISYLCRRVAVMYLGKIVEYGTVESVFTSPQHPYTRALLDAHPDPDPRHARLSPTIRDAETEAEKVGGCVFQRRCQYAEARCHESEPTLEPVDATSAAACFVRPFRDTA